MSSSHKSLRAIALQATLKQCPLFSTLQENALAEIADTCTLRSLQKGEFLFNEGDPAQGFYIVQTGAINVHRITPDGREQVIRVFRPFSSFAETALSAADKYPVHAVAIQSSQVILVQRRPLRDLVQHNPDVAFHIISAMSNHFRHLVQMLEDQKFKDIESRLANWLLRMASKSPNDASLIVHLDISKKLLANQLGVASETLSRALARFRESHWIEVDGPHIHILNPNALRHLLQSIT